MVIKVGEWSDEWTRTLRQFEKSNETSAKKFKIVGKTRWWDSNKKEDFSKALKELDMIYSKIVKSTKGRTWNTKALDLFEKVAKKAVKAGDDYLGVLDQLLTKERKNQAKDKGLGDAYMNALKILKKDIKACTTGAKSEYMEQRLKFEKASKGDASGEKIIKVEEAKLLAAIKGASSELQKAKGDFPSFLEMIRGGSLVTLSKVLRDTPCLDDGLGAKLASVVDDIQRYKHKPLPDNLLTEAEKQIENGTSAFKPIDKVAIAEKKEKFREPELKMLVARLTAVIKDTAQQLKR